MGSLLPDRHPNKDFFILDVSNASPKDDMASMEHPVFSLSVKPDMREPIYEHNGLRLKIVPSGKGLATIMDKDILLYCISKLVHSLNAGQEITPWVELSAHEVMVATNWRTNRESEEFEIDRKNEAGALSPFGRMTKVRIRVSDWTFRAVQGMEVLTISPLYFRLRRPLERRIYELARKHVGDQGKPFTIGLVKLREKVGSTSPLKKFRFFTKQIAQDGHIPQYDVALDGDHVIFSKKKTRLSRQGKFDLGDDSSLHVSPETFAKARRAAPGYDIQKLYQEWRAFTESQEELPRSLDAAFIGFCKKRHSSHPLR